MFKKRAGKQNSDLKITQSQSVTCTRKWSQEFIKKRINTVTQVNAVTLFGTSKPSSKVYFSTLGDKMFRKNSFRPIECEDPIRRVDHEVRLDNVDFTAFKADLIGGNLNIIPCNKGQARMRLQWDGTSNNMPSFNINDNVLYLKGKSFKPFIGQKNAYIVEVSIPKETHIDVFMRAGTLYLENVHGNLKVNMWAGAISGNAYTRKAKVDLRIGDLKLHHLRGSIAASVMTGDIQVLFDEINRGDQVNLTCHLGDVKARFPQGFFSSTDVYKKVGIIENNFEADVRVNSILGGTKLDMSYPDETPIQIDNSSFRL